MTTINVHLNNQDNIKVDVHTMSTGSICVGIEGEKYYDSISLFLSEATLLELYKKIETHLKEIGYRYAIKDGMISFEKLDEAQEHPDEETIQESETTSR